MAYQRRVKVEVVLVPLTRQRLLNLTAIIAVSVVLFIVLSIGMSQTAHAGGGIGSGGSSGGGSGGAQTYYGYGWYQYGINDAGPRYFKSGGPWSTVQQFCRDQGTVSVIMYIIYTSYWGNPNTAAVYNYVGWPDSWPGNKGNSGLPWMTVGQAKARYDALTVDKSGFTWGSNVAWFCYQDATPPPTDYTLVPTITVNQTAAEATSPVTVSPAVKNTGHAASRNTQWQLSQFVVPSGGSYPGAGNSGSPPAAYYGNGLTRINGGTGGSFPVGGPTAVGTSNLILPDAPAGSRVCYALSVQARSDQDGQWAHSLPVCVVIAKKPKVQVQGGDLSVGRLFSGASGPVLPSTIDTSTSVKTIGGSTQTFGSWVEYGLFATSSINGMASGSAFAGPGMANAMVCDYSTLSFTNSGSSTCTASTAIGNYQSTQLIPDVAASFPVGSATPSLGDSVTIDIGARQPQGVYTATGNVTVTGGGASVAKGEWFVLNAPTANVTITGNINYTNQLLGSTRDIPQVVIIAKNITIADSVTNVDAWLIARGATATDGVLSTCTFTSPDPQHLSFPAFPPFPTVTQNLGINVNVCNQQLTVNGPVMAQKLDLLRTAGSGAAAASGDPGEVFNLRPDAYMWGYERAISNGRVQTVYSQELPPRF